MILEQWMDIPNFEGVYQVSDKGNIKSLKRFEEGYLLSNVNKKNGYFSIVLRSGNRKRYTRVHRLVAEMFIPNPYGLPEVNHIDGNKQNNSVKNLEWVSRKENAQHAILHNPNIVAGMNYYNTDVRPKPIQQFSLSGQLVGEYKNSRIASNSTGVCRRNILQVASQDEYKPGKVRKQAGGFVWRFKTESETQNANQSNRE